MCQTNPEAFHIRSGERETNMRWGHRYIRGEGDVYPYPLVLRLYFLSLVPLKRKEWLRTTSCFTFRKQGSPSNLQGVAPSVRTVPRQGRRYPHESRPNGESADWPS